MTEGQGFQYVHTDAIGSAVATTDAVSAITSSTRYTPFGIALENPNILKDHGGFTGHIKDSATGLNYMQARYYDPVMGRLLSVDPVTFMDTGKPGMFNRYSYALNDPVNLTDSNGECPMFIPIAIFIIKEIAAEAASEATRGATDFLSVRRSGTKVAKFVGKEAITVAKNNRQGRASETRNLNERGIGKNVHRFPRPEGDTIPDGIDPDTGNPVEIKDVKNLYITKQIRNDIAVAEQKGVKLEIDTGTYTKVSKPVENNPTVIIKRHNDLGNGN